MLPGPAPAREDAVGYSVIVPAYNEEALLARTLTSIRAAMSRVGEPGEIVVADNNSTDRTAAIARDLGARVVFEPRNSISRARNAGARASRGRFLVFVDADTTLSPDVLGKAIGNLAAGGCCGGGALLALDDPSHRLGNRLVGLFNRNAAARQFAAGCFVYCLRDTFDGVGGFDERLYASTDIAFCRAAKKWGRAHDLAFRTITDAHVTTSSRKLRHPVHFLLTTALHTVFPFAVYFRSLCWFWYRRPAERPPRSRQAAP